MSNVHYITDENYIYQLLISAVKQLQVSWSVKRLNSAHKRQKRQEEEFIQTVVQLWWVETVNVSCSAIFKVDRQTDGSCSDVKHPQNVLWKCVNIIYSFRFISSVLFCRASRFYLYKRMLLKLARIRNKWIIDHCVCYVTLMRVLMHVIYI